jgi:alpha-D-ribose 1-methylphosphonate 5-triphosphate synthase subunit PhnI
MNSPAFAPVENLNTGRIALPDQGQVMQPVTSTQLSEVSATKSGKKGSRQLDVVVDKKAKLLQALKAVQEEEEQLRRKEREKNQKRIISILAEAGLDEVDSDTWKAHLPQIKRLLGA